MSRSKRSKTGKLTLPSLLFYVCLIISLSLFLPYDYWIGAAVGHYNYIKGHVWGFEAEPIVPSYMKDLSLNDFKQMLSYTDAAAAAAVTVMGDKQEYGAVPELIRRLNDTRPFRWGRKKEPTSLADLSKTALTQIIKGRISSDPENIGLLLPYFSAATEGSVLQRKAIIEILGEIREPLAIPLLSDLSRKNEPELHEAASRALAEINSSTMDNPGYSSLRRSQLGYVLGSILLIGLLLWWVISQLLSGAGKPLVMLSVVPIVLVGGMSWIMADDFRAGRVDDQSIGTAIAQRNMEALRTINYHDYTVYPGDSYVAHSLVTLGNDALIQSLMLLPTVQAVDDTSFTEVVDERVRWILARIVASKLGTPGLDELISTNDREVKIAVARVLGKLMVQNESIIDALTCLSKDEDKKVGATAAEVLPRVRRYPIWPDFLL